MDLSNFNSVFQWVIAHGYVLMFVAMFFEGPIITAAAAFASAFGYFNVFIVFAVSISADLFADLVFYYMGYYGREKLINRFGHRFGLTEARIKNLEDLACRHRTKTLIVSKLTPLLSFPGLMVMGAVKMSVKEFLLYCFLVILPKVLLFVIIGYYFGRLYDSIIKYIANGAIIFAVLALITIGIYFIYIRAAARVAKKIEKI